MMRARFHHREGTIDTARRLIRVEYVDEFGGFEAEVEQAGNEALVLRFEPKSLSSLSF